MVECGYIQTMDHYMLIKKWAQVTAAPFPSVSNKSNFTFEA